MASLGAFPEVGPQADCEIVYVRLKADLDEVGTRLTGDDVARALEELRALVLAWREEGRGFTSRRAMEELRHSGDYDDLARFGEWA